MCDTFCNVHKNCAGIGVRDIIFIKCRSQIYPHIYVRRVKIKSNDQPESRMQFHDVPRY